MSIYSGFATRALEETYDHCVCDMLFILQKRILKFYQNIDADQDKFWILFSQLYNQICHLQKTKYLQPKSSHILTEIYEFLKLQKDYRDLDLQEDLKKFEKSMALKINPEHEIKIKESQTNNFIRNASLSFGKIKKQLDPEKFVSLSCQNRNKWNQKSSQIFNDKLLNPETKRSNEKKAFLNKATLNTRSFREQIPKDFEEPKVAIQGGTDTTQMVKNYIQKMNKSYLRGYRKRKVRDQYLQTHGRSLATKMAQDRFRDYRPIQGTKFFDSAE